MSTTLNPEVAEALLSLLNDIRTAKDFVLAETPEVLQQMMGWHVMSAWFGVVAGIVLLIIGTTAVMIAYRASRDIDTCDVTIAGGMVAFMTLNAGIIALIIYTGTLLKITYYPKWYLVEALTRMLS